MTGSKFILSRSFYTRDTLTVAKELLAKHLVRRVGKPKLVGKIVEVEAYGGADDPASHAYRGITPRNQVMFGKGGFAYVYFTYGKHYCFNVTTEKEGVPGAVLIRALQPVSGIEMMRRNRGMKRLRYLTNGPGKLTEAMSITKRQNGLDLTKGGELFIREPQQEEDFEEVSTDRVGIRVGVEKPWRFHMKNNSFISRK
jgi:DNA-3-methyladenine glycosylase